MLSVADKHLPVLPQAPVLDLVITIKFVAITQLNRFFRLGDRTSALAVRRLRPRRPTAVDTYFDPLAKSIEMTSKSQQNNENTDDTIVY